jgi:integrase
MSVFESPKGSGKFVAKFQYKGVLRWVPGSPFQSKEAGEAAEEVHRSRLKRQRTDETCASFAMRWLEEWPRKAPSTRQLYSQAAHRFAADFGDIPLGEPDVLMARTWALGVPRNISKIIGTMYEDARHIGLVDINNFAGLKLPATEKTAEVAPPTEEELQKLMAATLVFGAEYAREFRELINFLSIEGLRSGELQALRHDYLDGDLVHVLKQRRDDGSYALPKGGKARDISFLQPARSVLEVDRRKGSPFVFHTPRGECLKKGNLYYLWMKVRDLSGTSPDRVAAGLRPIRVHDLRHYSATRLLELGATHFDVSVHLGHEDGGALVMSRYGHPSKDAARSRLLLLDQPATAGTGRSATSAGVG